MSSILSPPAASEGILCIRLSHKGDLAANAESIEEGMECLASILCLRNLVHNRGMHAAGFGTYTGHVNLSIVKFFAENRSMNNLTQ